VNWWQIKKRDADLERELRSDLEFEEEEQRESGISEEEAPRTALGGGWLRLMRERMMECLMLSAAGGALGLLLAFTALAWLTQTRHDMSRVESIHIDGAVRDGHPDDYFCQWFLRVR
jgi:hypothetical protein